MIKRIAITGPESTGKSKLAENLARYYKTVWVPEYAREYINGLSRPYYYDDILIIAKEQIRREEKMLGKANQFLFCDTELIVTKIWCEYKYGKCHDWILENIKNHKYDLYLLMDIDLPWKFDEQRENPNQRKQLFDLYLIELKNREFPFKIISGKSEKRLQNAISIIDSMLDKTN